MRKKKKVIFVGAFNKQNSLNTGGIIFACQGLLQSSLSERIDWQLIDTTPDNNLKRTFFERSLAALKRFKGFILLLFKANQVLIFMGGYQASVFEKGLMVLIAGLAGKRVILCPVTGLLPTFVNQSVLIRFFIKITFFFCYRVVCQSESWRTFFNEKIGYKTEKYVIIRNWIDLRSYAEIAEVQAKKENEAVVKILYLGWIIRDKGVFELIEAVDQLKALKIELWVAGDGDDLIILKQQAAELELKNIKFFGWVLKNQKIELLKKADIFVLPSYFEGLPNALLEAMASGIPVIATHVGGIPDVIADGKNGFLIEPKNSQMLAEKISTLCNDESLRREFSKQAYGRIEENHSFEQAISAFSKILL